MFNAKEFLAQYTQIAGAEKNLLLEVIKLVLQDVAAKLTTPEQALQVQAHFKKMFSEIGDPVLKDALVFVDEIFGAKFADIKEEDSNKCVEFIVVIELKDGVTCFRRKDLMTRAEAKALGSKIAAILDKGGHPLLACYQVLSKGEGAQLEVTKL